MHCKFALALNWWSSQVAPVLAVKHIKKWWEPPEDMEKLGALTSTRQNSYRKLKQGMKLVWENEIKNLFSVLFPICWAPFYCHSKAHVAEVLKIFLRLRMPFNFYVDEVPCIAAAANLMNGVSDFAGSNWRCWASETSAPPDMFEDSDGNGRKWYESADIDVPKQFRTMGRCQTTEQQFVFHNESSQGTATQCPSGTVPAQVPTRGVQEWCGLVCALIGTWWMYLNMAKCNQAHRTEFAYYPGW